MANNKLILQDLQRQIDRLNNLRDRIQNSPELQEPNEFPTIEDERWEHFDTTKTGGLHVKQHRERYWWISDHGRVKVTNNYNDSVRWPKISLSGGNEGSRYACLSPNYLLNKYVHKLVAIKFCHNPFGQISGREITVDHLDGNKTNNHYTNLEWVTSRENSWRYNQRKNNNEWWPSEQTIIPPDMTREQQDEIIIELYRNGATTGEIQRTLSLTQARVWRPVNEYRKANGLTGKNFETNQSSVV